MKAFGSFIRRPSKEGRWGGKAKETKRSLALDPPEESRSHLDRKSMNRRIGKTDGCLKIHSSLGHWVRWSSKDEALDRSCLPQI